MSAALLVIHNAGDPRAGARWAKLVKAWPGPAMAPDLPGHGIAPPPTGASYAPADAAFAAHQALQQAGMADGDITVLGHRWGGFAAELLAAAGRASQLVLVDGLGPPWCTVDEVVADQHRWLREVFADRAALAAPTTAPDPRLGHGFWSIWERGFVAEFRKSITVPVLAVETRASRTPPEQRAARLGDYSGKAEVVEAPDASASAVTDALRSAGLFQA
ncbi:MAG: alpha/beta hydrolase fold [Acidimicrobiales bacterium]|nr:alpha/beta hydrolase fold [Acidimicrobiales bacterium]